MNKIKLINNDCLQELKVLENNSIDIIITDPPYGIDYQSSWKIDKSKWKPKIANDKTPFISWIEDAYRVLKDKGCILCFTRYDTEDVFRKELRRVGFIDKAQVIWDKEIHGMGDLKGDFAPQHENIIFATKGRFIFPGKRPKSIIRVQRVNAEKLVHPNEKPVDLILKLLEAVAIKDSIVLDMFMGSGSTGVACVKYNCSFIGIELDTTYYNIACERLQ